FAATDPDYWWHVRTGQYIVETGTLPRVDMYSYTVPNRPWVTHEWLTEVLLYSVQLRFGYVGNVVLFGLLGALTALAVYAACRAHGLGEPAAAILMLWAAGMGMGSANVRPQILTTLLLATCTLLLTLYKRGHTRVLWALPPLLALWVNLHGGYIIGLAVLGLAAASEGALRLFGRPAAPWGPLVLIAVLSGAATFLSPHGLEAIRYPFSYLGSENAMMQYIAEWQSANFHERGPLIFAGSLLLAIFLGVGRRPLGPTEVLWTLVLALMALQSVRHIALYGVVATPLLGARLQAQLPSLRRPLAAWRRPSLLVVMWPLVALFVLRLVLTSGGWDRVQLGHEPSAATYPVGAVEYLRTHDLEGNLFNAYHWGGYLIYELFPNRTVFIDGRTDVYAELVGRYQGVATLQPDWRRVLDDYQVGLVLVEKASPLAVVLGDDPLWQEAYRGDVEQLFVRR
ncbi:MAG TPA: hypothetical protein VF153_05565, partial [Candidatus Limnocylindria bacterium]